MKLTIHDTMLVLGTSLAVLTIAAPYRNGAWLDPAATVSVAGLSLNVGLGLVMITLHVAKLRLVSLVAPAWRRNRVVGAVCFVMAAVLVAVSTFNAWSLLERQRSARVAEARTAVERADAIRDELRSVRERVALLGWRPLATVEAELSAERHHWIWGATAGCTKIESGMHRKFCAHFAKLEGVRAEAAQAEGLRQREEELARARLDRSPVTENREADDAEMLQAILIAVVIELTEVVLFGLAGFFAAPSVPAGSLSPRAEPAVQGSPQGRYSRRGERFRAAVEEPRISQQARPLSAAGRQPIEVVTDDGHDERGQRLLNASRPRAEAQAAGFVPEERRRAVDAFVASLRRGPNLRATGSALYDAYLATCRQRGWPQVPLNVFGQLLKPVIEAIGGRKVKASRQYYEGVDLPHR